MGLEQLRRKLLPRVLAIAASIDHLLSPEITAEAARLNATLQPLDAGRVWVAAVSLTTLLSCCSRVRARWLGSTPSGNEIAAAIARS